MPRVSALVLLVPVLGLTFVTIDFWPSLTGPSVAEAQQKNRPGIFKRLFGPREQERAIPPRASLPTKRRFSQASGKRTLCVRTCDGYYFPISYSVGRERFKIDEAVCKAMYGRAAANLYVHDADSPADRAVSLDGKPLAAEPVAFAFRHMFSPSCQAQLQNGLTRLGLIFVAKAAEAQSTATATMPGVPSPRVVKGTDPETLANRDGHFTVALVEPRRASKVAVASPPIRKLGPDYYYAEPIVVATLRDPPARGKVFTLIGSAEAGDKTMR
jgi:hypothetical protein